LCIHLLGKERPWILAHWDEKLSDYQATDFMELVERRYRGEPIQYITGQTEFYGLPFQVTPDVLIPRPETEHLVEKIVELAPIFPKPRLVDVGTGSGVIAIAFAHDWPNAEITATDLSASALSLARRNAERIGFDDRIRFQQGDLLAPVANEQFEIVVSNPPYVPEPDRATLAVEVRDHEPALALFAGPDGLDIYRRLIPQALACLVSGGFLVLEIGYHQSPAIADLLAVSGFQNIEFVPDLQQIPRVAVAQRP
jgi:release factor glutamine methyltransferase